MYSQAAFIAATSSSGSLDRDAIPWRSRSDPHAREFKSFVFVESWRPRDIWSATDSGISQAYRASSAPSGFRTYWALASSDASATIHAKITRRTIDHPSMRGLLTFFVNVT